ncbi:MAG: hypothetical protein LLG06_04580 [Desulfobacteraceae bacterium]|nr:hypothetical protein [Desulfobacteraceae bacterium]
MHAILERDTGLADIGDIGYAISPHSSPGIHSGPEIGHVVIDWMLCLAVPVLKHRPRRPTLLPDILVNNVANILVHESPQRTQIFHAVRYALEKFERFFVIDDEVYAYAYAHTH